MQYGGIFFLYESDVNFLFIRASICNKFSHESIYSHLSGGTCITSENWPTWPTDFLFVLWRVLFFLGGGGCHRNAKISIRKYNFLIHVLAQCV